MSDEGRVLSLKDLKKENEKDTPPADDVIVDTEVDPDPDADPAPDSDPDPAPDADPDPDPDAGPDPDADPDADPAEANDAWLKSDLDEDEALAISDSEAGKIRRKYKAQATKAKDEAGVLREENTRLKAQQVPPVVAKTPGEPKRDAFESDLLYLEARQDWKSEINEVKQQTAFTARNTKAAQDADVVAVGESVDEHYLRAEKLAGKSNITPEAYQSADQRVRNAVEAKFPGAGDLVIDKLIQKLGAGSEKVFYHLGVNKARLNKFVDSFDEDEGLSAAMFLATLNAELKAPAKRTSSAPAPGEDVRGDSRVNPVDAKAKKEYTRATKSGDPQKAWDIKKKAKANKVDTKGW